MATTTHTTDSVDQTAERAVSAETVTFGRTLVDGVPVDEGLTLPVDSPTMALLASATGPLLSNPQLGEYGIALVTAEETEGASLRALAITPPGAQGPPEHVHPNYAERFEIIEGSFVVEVDGTPQLLESGDHATVEAGRRHTFRNESDDYASVVVEARPAGRLTDVVQSMFGLAHEGKLTADGNPPFWQVMVMADELRDDTVFTSPPPVVQRLLSAVCAPIGRRLGYRAAYPAYNDPAFWTERVEQPPAR